MKELIVLKIFIECLSCYNELLKLKNEFGELNETVKIQQEKFSTLYNIIENSGLEEEYQEWKKGQAI